MTRADREATYAAVSPATPDPTTATVRWPRRAVTPGPGQSKSAIGGLVGDVDPPAAPTVIPAAVAVAASPVSTVWSGLDRHHPADTMPSPGWSRPELADLPAGGGGNVLGDDDRLVQGVRRVTVADAPPGKSSDVRSCGRRSTWSVAELDLAAVVGPGLLPHHDPGAREDERRPQRRRRAASAGGGASAQTSSSPAAGPSAAGAAGCLVAAGLRGRLRGDLGRQGCTLAILPSNRSRSCGGGAVVVVSAIMLAAQARHLGLALGALGEVTPRTRHAEGSSSASTAGA